MLKRVLRRVAQALVIVLLVVVPVPVGRLFVKLFDTKPRAIATQPIRQKKRP